MKRLFELQRDLARRRNKLEEFNKMEDIRKQDALTLLGTPVQTTPINNKSSTIDDKKLEATETLKM